MGMCERRDSNSSSSKSGDGGNTEAGDDEWNHAEEDWEGGGDGYGYGGNGNGNGNGNGGVSGRLVVYGEGRVGASDLPMRSLLSAYCSGAAGGIEPSHVGSGSSGDLAAEAALVMEGAAMEINGQCNVEGWCESILPHAKHPGLQNVGAGVWGQDSSSSGGGDDDGGVGSVEVVVGACGSFEERAVVDACVVSGQRAMVDCGVFGGKTHCQVRCRRRG